MANIIAILAGVGLSDMDRMTMIELGEWHDRAIARAPKQE